MPSLVLGTVLGGGLFVYIWRKLNDAEVQRARADTDESIMKADEQATADELERKQAREGAENADKGVENW